MNKRKVAVIMGGPSEEHDISLLTAKAIQDGLNKDTYEILPVLISKSNKWSINGQPSLSDTVAIHELKKQHVDVVFLAVHGTYGEDGKIQKKLEKAGIRFTGSGSKASQQAFNKHQAQQLYLKHKLLIPRYSVLEDKGVPVTTTLPLVIKPVSQGSSVGVSIVKKPEHIEPSITLALNHDVEVMAQEYIQGREVSCGILEIDGQLQALPPTELIPLSSEFFDFEAKYTQGATNEITPPDMPDKTVNKIQEIAVTAHRLLNCRGCSRTDMIVRGKDIFVIETNTLPGMTRTSILPQQAQVAGITFSKLLDIIIDAAHI